MATDGFIEIPGIILLIACLLRCVQYVAQSHIKQIKAFWLASVLVLIAILRRELNYLPELFIPSDFSLLSHSYDWWEDAILLAIYLMSVGLLIYSWRYLWVVLKNVNVSLYLGVATLALLQYMGENAIGFPHTFGGILEELAETAIYVLALVYLWRFKLSDFELRLLRQLNFELSHASH